MIASKLFGFLVEEGLFETVIDILKNEYGLVDGKLESSTGNYRVLVWEDENGVISEIILWTLNIDTGDYSEVFKGSLSETIEYLENR